MKKRVVIIGAGHGGVQAASTFREEGFEGEIIMISDELDAPYQKPPLSKGYLQGKQNAQAILFRSENYYNDNAIDLKLGVRVAKIHSEKNEIQLSDGAAIKYDYLIIATGACNRRLRFNGQMAENVYYLRNFSDAKMIEEKINPAQHIVIIGGGFIGLELAALAVEKNKKVTVIETEDRLMKRVLPEALSKVFYETHVAHGVEMILGVSVVNIIDGKKIKLSNGNEIDADLILAGIGVIVESELTENSGVLFDNGIVVNPFQQTNIENIYAIGDCANHYNPFAKKSLRLESVQNAVDQAKVAAAHIIDKPFEYNTVPWFWTNQYHLKLQMAGISFGFDEGIIRQSPKPECFSVYYFKEEKLIGVDSLNRPADHLNARKLLTAGISPSKMEVADFEFNLNGLLV
ncbi:3-phenylpropionate/trans-cinnamate dioxygenase ferredoxin reductase subunit [Flavobacterium sp. PL11]|jgi:3-phenylpropionate/trans-cinnamate dioxygenase ferredoxin reductase subunit|uniref:NAD(P)/FAD-dependent oxidoreductase n=1 Tax=Flavobacterium sp. PL11 TaxID=3071717 RepID=UPI002E06431D|nr:3-phenylpropionate/trans-cinnamate dioxygenase ferredoxin reductase subunit [Flavobacterium sp. PL11]